MRSSWLVPYSAQSAAHTSSSSAQSSDAAGFEPDLGKVVREGLRGAVTLGSSVGMGVAVYRRALWHAGTGRLAPPLASGAAAVPALGVGASAMVDAASARAMGMPTDPECQSMGGLHWISPAMNGLALAAWRYAPGWKPAAGTVPDLLVHVLLSAGGGAVAYSTREWLAQRALARRRDPLPALQDAVPTIPDRFFARTTTQLASTALRLRVLAQPERAAGLYVPVLLSSCVPYGWREDLARVIAQVRKKREVGTT